MSALTNAVFGVGTGAAFALLAVGIVLVYRASGVLNFAHASMAMVCAYVNFELLERFPGVPVGVALLAAVAFGAALGAGLHAVVFRPLAGASQVVKLLASFGVAGALQGLVGVVFERLGTPTTFGRSLFPVDRGVVLFGAAIPYQRLALIGVGVGLAGGLAALLHRTQFGVYVRALAQNPLAARLAGVPERQVQAVTWGLAGATAAVAGVLVVPFGVLSPLALSGFQLKALAAALVGGFVSPVAAVAGGLGLGLVQELLVEAPPPLDGLRGAVAGVVVIALLLVRVERFFVSPLEAQALEAEAAFARVSAPALTGSPRAWLTGGALACLVLTAVSGFWAFVLTRTFLYAVLGLSLVVLTGWSGQVSLMPGTFAGVGASLAWVFGAKLGYPFALAVPMAATATLPVCLVVGAVALRLRPLYLAVATVALAGVFEEVLFTQRWFANAGEAMRVSRPSLLAGDHVYGVFVGIVATLAFAMAAALGRSRTGRALQMARDNEAAAAAAGANPVKYKLVAFAFSAVLAGLSGALLAHLLGAYSAAAFGFLVLSLSAFGLAIVGGIRSPVGPLVGALLFVLVSEVFRSSGSVSDWLSVAVGVGIVVVLAVEPGGLAGLAGRLRDRLSGRATMADEDWGVPEAVPELAGRGAAGG